MSQIWKWSDAVSITTSLEPALAVERIGHAWSHEFFVRPGPHGAASAMEFGGQYVTPQRAAARITLRGTIRSAADGQAVRMTLLSEPQPSAFFLFSAGALLLPLLAFMVDALEFRQALFSWCAGVALFGAAQWVVAGVAIGRVSRKLAASLSSRPGETASTGFGQTPGASSTTE